MRKVYCIPGFGVDEKVFSKLSIDAAMHCINWLQPGKTESLTDYARRMAADIVEENPVIIGVSFGGMVALEINKFLPLHQLIVISSVKCRKELPLQLRVIGNLKLDKIFPVKKIQQNDKVYAIANKRLGAVTDEEKALANSYRRRGDIGYINWSFDKILNWQNRDYPENIVHIHGDSDKIFPIKSINATHVIKNGTHMMVMNRADEISKIINNVLQQIQ